MVHPRSLPALPTHANVYEDGAAGSGRLCVWEDGRVSVFLPNLQTPKLNPLPSKHTFLKTLYYSVNRHSTG